MIGSEIGPAVAGLGITAIIPSKPSTHHARLISTPSRRNPSGFPRPGVVRHAYAGAVASGRQSAVLPPETTTRQRGDAGAHQEQAGGLRNRIQGRVVDGGHLRGQSESEDSSVSLIGLMPNAISSPATVPHGVEVSNLESNHIKGPSPENLRTPFSTCSKPNGLASSCSNTSMASGFALETKCNVMLVIPALNACSDTEYRALGEVVQRPWAVRKRNGLARVNGFGPEHASPDPDDRVDHSDGTSARNRGHEQRHQEHSRNEAQTSHSYLPEKSAAS